MATKDLELKPDQLRTACDASQLGFETTADLPELEDHVGQARAIAAISFGLGMEAKGYNIFAAGPTGTGRNFAVLSHAKAAAAKQPAPDDWCYVHNFNDPRHPAAIRLPSGLGPQFAQGIEDLLNACRQEIPRVFESEAYEDRKEKAISDIQTRRSQLLQELDEEARRASFVIQPTPMGLITVPVVDGKSVSREQFDLLPEEKRRDFNEKMERLHERVQEVLTQARQIERESHRRVEELDREVAMAAVGDRFGELKDKYATNPAVVSHLDALAEDVVAHQADFRAVEQPNPDGHLSEGIPTRYRVNVLVTHQDGDGAPVVEENSPSYYNLLGRLEYRPLGGAAITDHMLIKPGAVHRANGGYLVLQALDILTAPFTWDALKRALRSQEATIENIGEQWTPIPAATLSPEPIPLDLKVIMIGSPLLYFILYNYDEDFGKLFKVKADFDIDMKADESACRAYATFIATYCRRHHLRPLTKEAVAGIIDHGRRLAEDQERLSTRFAEVSDLLTQSDFWAGQSQAEVVTADHIKRALQQKEYRVGRLEEYVLDLIRRGDLVVDVTGAKLGQVNGLAVLDLGDHIFGRPARITAQVTPGRAGVVNIEREARLSGQIHQKAVMILSGYLTGTYGADSPLSLCASLAFEQSYGPIEGDSASCAELYAILSSLAGAPVKQGLAVTGSVDQYGNVQVIGGANYKIEGFYAACKSKGLTGEQGVIIPRGNVKNLMLQPEVVQAVAEGRFHIWGISTVDEGVELLTGLRAGSLAEPDTVHGRVMARLQQFSEALKGSREERPATFIEVPPGAAGPRPPRPPSPPREPPGPPTPPIPPA